MGKGKKPLDRFVLVDKLKGEGGSSLDRISLGNKTLFDKWLSRFFRKKDAL